VSNAVALTDARRDADAAREIGGCSEDVVNAVERKSTARSTTDSILEGLELKETQMGPGCRAETGRALREIAQKCSYLTEHRKGRVQPARRCYRESDDPTRATRNLWNDLGVKQSAWGI
jgi:hypothetical protein